LDQSKLGLGGILGALGASAESPASGIPYWLETAMPFSMALEAPRPSNDPRPQVASPPAWDSQALSNLPALPSADFDSNTPYWLRTALPSGVNSEMFGAPQAPAEEPPNPAPQLWPATARDVAVPPTLPALLSSRSTPTPNYRRQLNDTLANTWQPDRSAAPAGAEHIAFSDTWPVASSGSPANRQWMGGGIGAESDPRVISDVTPDNDWRPGTRYAQNREPPGRGFRPLIIRGRLVEPEPGQASRLFEAQTRAEKTIARVREIDPKWRPRPSAYESVEGLIRAYEADAEQAQARLRELTAPLLPTIPRERPPTASGRNDIARAAARWLARRWLAQEQRYVVEGVDWFSEYEPSVQAYLDSPKTLQELQQAVSAPKPGYDIHHIVEKDSARQDGFPPRMINAPENLLRIPRFKHWEITGWYMTKNDAYKGLSPRDYLRGKAWTDRIGVGLDALILHGVLKP
jgi:hypothetical protein